MKKTALELTDTFGSSVLFACASERELELVLRIMMDTNMPSCILQRYEGIANNLSMVTSYESISMRYMNQATKLWLKGEMSNFDYLMHLNVAAGRSFQDLTSYPVFPWILADYKSEELDLSDSQSFRDLSKPMGVLGDKRAAQFKERYDSLNDFRNTDSPPAFFYGTHYSCTGYVLHYLMRIKPYTHMAISHQGGHFDKADRLFRSVESCWTSASQDNLQDVRELIPEFFCLPEFLVNSNKFDFGLTQNGETVDDVDLPPWAKGSAKEFIRIHRLALESKHVSENLHSWIDLIFGYKQRGVEAEKAANLFVHLTYDGVVDIDAIHDPVLKASTISQINNFGQTPSQLFQRPHPKKIVPDIATTTNQGTVIDSSGVGWHDQMAPPLSTVGASMLTRLNQSVHTQFTFKTQLNDGKIDSNRNLPIGDIWIQARDKLMAAPVGCVFLKPKCNQYLQFSSQCNGLSIKVLQLAIGALDTDRELSSHENLHNGPIRAICCSEDGKIVVTCSNDHTVRMWHLRAVGDAKKLEHLWTFCGHTDTVNCVDYCSEYSLIVSGSVDGTCLMWDSRQGKRIRNLGDSTRPVLSVSINRIGGSISVLTSTHLFIYHVNGDIIGSSDLTDFNSNTNRV